MQAGTVKGSGKCLSFSELFWQGVVPFAAVPVDEKQCIGFPILPQNGTMPVAAVKKTQRAFGHRPALFPHGRELSGKIEQIGVWVPPRVAASVEGVGKPLHARFVTIVDARDTGQEKLQCHCKLELFHCLEVMARRQGLRPPARYGLFLRNYKKRAL